MDWDAVADELYGLEPGEFTAARDQRAKAARDAGDRQLAEQIRGLRRPTLAAWASNLLVHEQPAEADALLELGEALRQAHQDLDGERLRELSGQQHQVIYALARQAKQLTAQAGRRISEDAVREVQETLHAVLADPDAARQWAEARLTQPLTAPSGFTAATGATPSAPARTRKEKAAERVTDLDQARNRRQRQQEQLAQARQQAEEAQRELRAREADRASAQDQLEHAHHEQEEAQRRIDELGAQLKEAEAEERQARKSEQDARDRVRQADHAERQARRRAEDAAVHVERLAATM